MKRFISIICAILLPITLSACGSRTLSPTYDGVVEFEEADLSCTADLFADDDTMTLTITSPPHLSGISYEYRDGELHTTLDGLDCVTSPESLPATAVPSLLYAMFSTADEAEYQGSENGIDSFLLHTRGGDMTVTAKGGKPLALSFGNRYVEFK